MENSEKLKEMYDTFNEMSISELEEALSSDASREMKIFCRALINLKLQITKEKIVGEILL